MGSSEGERDPGNRFVEVRFLDGAMEYARAGAIPGGLDNNREFAGTVSKAPVQWSDCCSTRRLQADC